MSMVNRITRCKTSKSMETYSRINEEAKLIQDPTEITRYLLQNIDTTNEFLIYCNSYGLGSHGNVKININIFGCGKSELLHLNIEEIHDDIIMKLVDKFGVNEVFMGIIGDQQKYSLFEKFVNLGLELYYEYNSNNGPTRIGDYMLSIEKMWFKFGHLKTVNSMIDSGFSLENIKIVTINYIFKLLWCQKNSPVYNGNKKKDIRIKRLSSMIEKIVEDNSNNKEKIENILVLAIIYKLSDCIKLITEKYSGIVDHNIIIGKIYDVTDDDLKEYHNYDFDDSLTELGFDQDKIYKINTVVDIFRYIGYSKIDLEYIRE